MPLKKFGVYFFNVNAYFFILVIFYFGVAPITWGRLSLGVLGLRTKATHAILEIMFNLYIKIS